jgi:hypothetical protein
VSVPSSLRLVNLTHEGPTRFLQPKAGLTAHLLLLDQFEQVGT